jgi:hypothetical protein
MIRVALQWTRGARVQQMHNAGGPHMYRMLCLTIAALTIAFASFPTSTLAEISVMQVKLTAKQIEGFITAQDDILPVVEKMQDAIPSEYEAELERATKKHGFKNLAEYDTIASNISIVMAAIDPQTRAFIDPQVAIRKEIEDMRSDETIPQSEKGNLLEELKAALEAAEPMTITLR